MAKIVLSFLFKTTVIVEIHYINVKKNPSNVTTMYVWMYKCTFKMLKNKHITVICMCYHFHDTWEQIACLTTSVFLFSDLQKRSMLESKTGQRKWISLRKTSSLSQSMNSKSREENYQKITSCLFSVKG